MNMLPNDSHPGQGCSCGSCLEKYPETTVSDNGFAEMAGFSRDVKAIEQSMLNTQQLLRDSTFELNARQRLIEHYQRKNADHERMVGKLYELLKQDDMDGAMDIVRDEFYAINGPSD